MAGGTLATYFRALSMRSERGSATCSALVPGALFLSGAG